VLLNGFFVYSRILSSGSEGYYNKNNYLLLYVEYKFPKLYGTASIPN